MRSPSSTITLKPFSASWSAAETPVKPAPMMQTSVVCSPVSVSRARLSLAVCAYQEGAWPGLVAEVLVLSLMSYRPYVGVVFDVGDAQGEFRDFLLLAGGVEGPEFLAERRIGEARLAEALKCIVPVGGQGLVVDR